MENQTPTVFPEPHLLAKSSFQVLLDTLKKYQYKVLGPVVQEGAIKKYEEAVQAQPSLAEAHYNLALTLD